MVIRRIEFLPPGFRRGWPFFDLDEEVERHFGLSIERLQARFLTGRRGSTRAA